jgi:hypothetical protein
VAWACDRIRGRVRNETSWLTAEEDIVGGVREINEKVEGSTGNQEK